MTYYFLFFLSREPAPVLPVPIATPTETKPKRTRKKKNATESSVPAQNVQTAQPVTIQTPVINNHQMMPQHNYRYIVNTKIFFFCGCIH